MKKILILFIILTLTACHVSHKSSSDDPEIGTYIISSITFENKEIKENDKVWKELFKQEENLYSISLKEESLFEMKMGTTINGDYSIHEKELILSSNKKETKATIENDCITINIKDDTFLFKKVSSNEKIN